MKRSRIIAGAIAAAAVAALGAGYAYNQANSALTISTAQAVTQNLDVTVNASGTVDAAAPVSVFAPQAGTLKTLNVADGQRVKAGDTLATLDDASLTDAVATARTGVTQAEAKVTQAKAQIAQAKAQITQADASIDAADAQAKAAQGQKAAASNQLRTARALPDDTDTQADARRSAIRDAEAAQTQAEAAADAAEATRKQAEASKAQAKATKASAEAARDAAETGVDAANQALASAQSNAAKTAVKAPVAGTVELAPVNPAAPTGAKLAAGAAVTTASPILALIDDSSLAFVAQVDEADIADVKAGAQASVTLDAYPGQPLAGTVSEIANRSVATKTGGVAYEVKVPLTSGNTTLRRGMSGDVDLATAQIADALVVPVNAVAADGASKYVFKVAGDKVTKVGVEVGASTDALAQITSGLSAGDVVATGQLTALTDGTKVHVGE